jgi:hypothetical protein
MMNGLVDTHITYSNAALSEATGTSPPCPVITSFM